MPWLFVECTDVSVSEKQGGVHGQCRYTQDTAHASGLSHANYKVHPHKRTGDRDYIIIREDTLLDDSNLSSAYSTTSCKTSSRVACRISNEQNARESGVLGEECTTKPSGCPYVCVCAYVKQVWVCYA